MSNLILNIDVLKSMDRMGVVTLENVDEYKKLAKKLYNKNKTKISQTKRPVFETKEEDIAWEVEEIRRCMYGHKGLNGKSYFYLNYCYIKTMNGYKLPERRVSDDAYFDLIEKSSMYSEPNEYKGKPIVILKRRRWGYSTKAASDMLHEALFRKGAEIGAVSKSERDGEVFLRKVKEMWDKLPDFLRHPIDGKNTKTHIEFVRKTEDTRGKIKWTGNHSIINSVAPVPTAFEGRMLTKFIFDEVGKTSDGEELFNMTYDCLTLDGELVGQITVGGTSGNVDKEGKALKEFWNNHDNPAYNFTRFFVPAWASIDVDEYGNDRNIEEQIDKIIEKRERMLKKGGRAYYDMLQKHPLTPQEALLSNKVSGIGNIGNITNRLETLRKEGEQALKRGSFEWDKSGNGEAVFIPNPLGKVYIYEDYNPHYRYASGIDVVDHDGTGSSLSDQAMYIMRHDYKTSNARLACRYVDRTEKVEDYYEQALLASIYYGKHKPLVENNRTGLIKWCDYNGFLGSLKKEPLPNNTVLRKYTPKIGARKNSNSEIEFRQVGDKYTSDDYIEGIPDIELLEELLDYGEKNTDKAVAYLWALVSLEDDLTRRTNEVKKEISKGGFKKLTFSKKNGRIVRNR